MSSDPLIVPALLPSGSLQYATLSAGATAQDVISALGGQRDVRDDVLGDLALHKWAVQQVRKQQSGRQWEEHELEVLGDGLLAPTDKIAPLLDTADKRADEPAARHFSSFPLTSHLHTPVFKLVSLHPFLSVSVSFLRVPEIHDDFKWRVFLSRNTTVDAVIDLIADELGLSKALPVPGGGNLEYVLEEVWYTKEGEKSTRLSLSSIMSKIIEASQRKGSTFRLCVPDEWYRRAKPRSLSSTSFDPTEDTIKRLADLEKAEQEEEEEEEEGTAKLPDISPPRPTSPSVDWRASLSQSRLTSLFSGWQTPAAPAAPAAPTTPTAVVTPTPQGTIGRKSVSEPRIMEQHTGGSVGGAAQPTNLDTLTEEVDDSEFEQFLDEMGLKGAKRAAMYNLPATNKRYLLQQNRKTTTGGDSTPENGTIRGGPSSAFPSPSHPSSSSAATYGPTTAAALLPRIVPQLTGGGDGGLMKRFSMATWGAASAPAPPVVSADQDNRGSGEFDTTGTVKHARKTSLEQLAAQAQAQTMFQAQGQSQSQNQNQNQGYGHGHGNGHGQQEQAQQALQPQMTGTGGLWSSWWTSSGGSAATVSRATGSGSSAATAAPGASGTPGAGAAKDESATSARRYVEGMKALRAGDAKLVKHLISLRVHLATAKVAWVEEFIGEKGMGAIGDLLGGLVGKGGKRRNLSDVEGTVLQEVVKCLRVLLNTQPGFNSVVASPILITHIAYALHGSALKLRTLVAELLAAICVLSLHEGHRAVLAALSDYRIAFDEAFRFQGLVDALKLPDIPDDVSISSFEEEEGTWEARTAYMALVNALTNCPEALEERVLLREEFGRRGLNEVIVALRYTKPPDALQTQLDVYTEEKFEDEEDMRERARKAYSSSARGGHGGGHGKEASESAMLLEEVLQSAKEQQMGAGMVALLRQLEGVFESEADSQYKSDLLAIVQSFVQQIVLVGDFHENWQDFVKRFVDSVKHYSGHELDIRKSKDYDSVSIVEVELEDLRAKIDELSEENLQLTTERDGHMAELATLKSLAPSPTPKKSGSDNMHGLVQRLVQKEKQVMQLKADVDRLQALNPADSKEADERAKRDRDRAKWNTLMDEIAKLKMKQTEMESTISMKDKEILYLKRALESVYSRFQTREEERSGADLDAQTLASRAIESMTRKDDEIASLEEDIIELKRLLAEKPKYITETDFKSQNSPPPPPPPVSKAKSARSKPLAPAPVSVSRATAPPPPPPPPPLQRRSSNAPSVQEDADDASSRSTTPTPSTPVASAGGGPPPPPPPMPGAPGLPGMPPPPPPPPVVGYTAPKPMRPAKRLKPFFWNKLTPKDLGSHTVWNDAGMGVVDGLGEFAIDDLETTFSLENTQSDKPAKTEQANKGGITTLLDITRANNIGIMLNRIKLSSLQIRRALLDLDDNKLSVDDLKYISKQLPTAEEISRIKDYDDISKLAKADQYFFEIMVIPRLQERLDCMIYRRKLELDIEEVRPDLKYLRDASKELRASERFKRTLKAVLAIGNALNMSTFRGGAHGFKLEALLKMKETKTAKGGKECPTLLHYVARVLIRTDPSLMLFIEEMPSVEPAARISTQTLSQSVQTMVASLAKVKEEVHLLKQLRHPSSGDQFVAIMQPFVERQSTSIDALKKMMDAVEGDLRSLLAYYGESGDPSDGIKPEDFFGIVCSFSTTLQKAALEVHEAEQKTKSKVPKLVTTGAPTPDGLPSSSNQNGNLLAPPSGPERPKTPQSIGRGDVDAAIRTLKEGRRRSRPPRQGGQPRASKIFLDGRPESRIFDPTA
ncbi:hypothetical protein CONPUDRAFT_139713 [Coniophora puteana RWD-64-598 SS2]|uniref:FH2-domain-containing protein n=1 Tax=Coniophora puteana (strain RWD-64-598) TaxID=741705 RepID=A0A5M3MAM2_CONPW|nr:uncharacterized protein CONPUDRAFT_139713 [Coniophora puteana RWD-64-598 SS2]EIW76318.1 hypothetical protein CONPUDRAFT_139713 [Coniophora puteana RWD-64-598 SS2]